MLKGQASLAVWDYACIILIKHFNLKCFNLVSVQKLLAMILRVLLGEGVHSGTKDGMESWE